jgi:hypothetical protein
MNPIHGERGKLYFAVQCKNKSCQVRLYVSGASHDESSIDAKAKLAGESVRCPMCTQETPIASSQFVVIEVR